MRHFCPKCLSNCNKKKQHSIFLEIKCSNCGHNWFETPESNKPITLKKADLQNIGVDND